MRKWTWTAAATVVGMSAWTVAASAPASAVPDSSDQVVSGVKDLGGGAQYNLRRGVFVAKDLGGGAYWLTTSKAVDTVITATESGREAILIVNDTVIRPVQDATGL